VLNSFFILLIFPLFSFLLDEFVPFYLSSVWFFVGVSLDCFIIFNHPSVSLGWLFFFFFIDFSNHSSSLLPPSFFLNSL